MIIIETCPECGHDLYDLVLATYPSIPQKKCFNCGWEWTGVQENIVRVPFADNDSLQCVVKNNEKEIQEHLATAINTMITNHTSKHME